MCHFTHLINLNNSKTARFIYSPGSILEFSCQMCLTIKSKINPSIVVVVVVNRQNLKFVRSKSTFSKTGDNLVLFLSTAEIKVLSSFELVLEHDTNCQHT